jgi:hypothetical protein
MNDGPCRRVEDDSVEGGSSSSSSRPSPSVTGVLAGRGVDGTGVRTSSSSPSTSGAATGEQQRKRKRPATEGDIGDDNDEVVAEKAAKGVEGNYGNVGTSDPPSQEPPTRTTTHPRQPQQPQQQQPPLEHEPLAPATGMTMGPPPPLRLHEVPPFRENDDALDILSRAFFEPYRHVAEKRNRELKGQTIHEVLYRFFDGTESVCALECLSREYGVRYSSVREYYEGADLVTKQRLGAARMKAKYGCDFHEAEISTAEIDIALLPLVRVDGDEGEDGISKRTVDLALLKPLRVPKDDPFLASDKIYVRDCMRFVFGLFGEDDCATPDKPRRPPNKDFSAVLVGSPGVGTSTLFFLAALRQAKHSPIVHYRTSSKGPASVIVLSPRTSGSRNGPGVVRAWFTRNLTLDRRALEGRGLAYVNADLITCGVVDKNACYTFIDGPTFPKRNTRAHIIDALDDNFDYFCTSGGFGGFSQEQDENREWVLDGWTEREAVCALGMLGNTKEDAEMAFALCGGSIGNMVRATSNDDDFRKMMDRVIDAALAQQNGAVWARSTWQPDDPDNDLARLRTMFELRGTASEATRKKVMRAYQVVDSRYALKRLCTELSSMCPFFEAFHVAQTSKVGTAKHIYFEHMVHQWAVHNKDSNLIRCFSRVCWSSGSIEACVEQLSSPNVYWIAGKQNFPNVDSALVHNHSLFAFLMTTTNTHRFDRATFEKLFVDKVRVKCRVHRVVLCFVHPQEVAFRIPNDLPTSHPWTRLRSHVRSLACTLGSRVGAEAWAGEPTLECRAFAVDTRSPVCISNSLSTLFRGL